MKHTNGLFRRLAAICTSGLLAQTMLTAMPVDSIYAASVCVVDTATEYQVIEGFGGINHPEWTGSDLTDAQVQKAFGNGEDELGFTILRIFVNPDKNQWYRALPVAQAATNMGVTVFASPWEPPADLAESGGSNGKLHLPRSNYGAYAQHLNDFGNYMKDNNVDLYAISVQNEPDYAHDWTYWSTDETTDFLANFGDQITSTRVMSPESFQYAPENASWVADGGKKFYTKILNNQKAMENCDLFGTHFYGTTREWMDFPALENSGKQIWMTEVYVPNSSSDADTWPEALEVSQNIHNGLVVGNMSAYVWWYIRRSYGPMKEDGNISKRGYCMAQYSKFVRPNSVRINCTEQPADNVYISAYKGENNQITVVAVNMGTTDYAQEFSISGGEQISNITRYRTSGSENLAKTENMEFTDNSFFAQLPAQSVSTFIITANVEPDTNGYYFHSTFEGDTDSWSGRGSADVTLSGRTAYLGNEALLVQNRESAWNGAYRALNTAAFVPGNAYSFSVVASNLDGDAAATTFYLKLQYTDSEGTTQYSSIAEAAVAQGDWVQLANPNYTIPIGASNLQLYVETAEGTDNFYIDEAIGAVAGTVIEGPAETTTTTTTTTAEIVTSHLGDVNCDGVVKINDVILLNRFLAEDTAISISAQGMRNAECGSEPGVTGEDSTAILSILAGLSRE